MARRSLPMSTLMVVLLLAVVAAAAGGVARAQTGDDDVYTGCLTDRGTLKKVAVGAEPLRPCSGRETEVSWNASGPPGPVASLSVEQRTVHGIAAPHLPSSFTSTCRDGEIVTGGGYTIGSVGLDDKVFVNTPTEENGWFVSVVNHTDFELDVWVTAICIDTG